MTTSTLTLYRSTDGASHRVTDPIRAALIRQLIKYAVQRTMFCPVTGEILDTRKCAALFLGENPESADLKAVISLAAFRRMVAVGQEDRDANGGKGDWLSGKGRVIWVRLPSGFRASEVYTPAPDAPADNDDAPTLF